MRKLLAILGPTATGKTDLALQLASKFVGEIISADSRQVYKGLDIGTGKMPSRVKSRESRVKKGKGFWEIDGAKIWMYDVVDPKRQYNVSRFVKVAETKIEEIFKKGKLPIIVGGSGLYIKALLEGLSNLKYPIDKKLRKNLSRLTKLQLQERLKGISLKLFEKLNSSDRENPRRLIRAIELGKVKNQKLKVKNYQVLKIGLTTRKDILYKISDERLISRIDQGMLEEAENLKAAGLSIKRMKQLGLEYGVLADFLVGNIKKSDLTKILQGKIHGYIRRQLTWFKKEKGVNWFDITSKDFPVNIEKQVIKWYYSAHVTQDRYLT